MHTREWSNTSGCCSSMVVCASKRCLAITGLKNKTANSGNVETNECDIKLSTLMPTGLWIVSSSVRGMTLISLATFMKMVLKLSSTYVVSSVGRLLVYTFVQSSIIKVTKKLSFTMSLNKSELFFEKWLISRFTEWEHSVVPNIRCVSQIKKK